MSKPTSSQYPNHFSAQASTNRTDTKVRSVDNKGNGITNDFAKVSPTIKCYRCQGYGHVATN